MNSDFNEFYHEVREALALAYDIESETIKPNMIGSLIKELGGYRRQLSKAEERLLEMGEILRKYIELIPSLHGKPRDHQTRTNTTKKSNQPKH